MDAFFCAFLIVLKVNIFKPVNKLFILPMNQNRISEVETPIYLDAVVQEMLSQVTF